MGGKGDAALAQHGYNLLLSLKGRASSDAAGIHDVVKAQEDETELAFKLEEMPQMFLASLRKDGKTNTGAMRSDSNALESETFPPHDIVRMVLTVIAGDPTNHRTERFLRLLRYFSVNLYNASAKARTHLRDALNALGPIIMSASSGRAFRSQDASQGHGKETETVREAKEESLLAVGQEQSQNKTPMASGKQLVRSEYLLLVASFAGAGGDMREIATGVKYALEIVTGILKESSTRKLYVEPVQQFINAIAESFLKREDPEYSADILKELSPIINAYGSLFDLTALLKVLVTLSSKPVYANKTVFSVAVVHHFCAAVLQICEMAVSENMLFKLQFREAFIALLSRAVCLLGADVVKELERREPSPEFLSGIILPFVTSLRTTKQLSSEAQWPDSVRQDMHQRAWVRLFVYSLSPFDQQPTSSADATRNVLLRATSNASHGGEGDRHGHERGSRHRMQTYERTVTAVHLAMSLVLFKAIVVRGQDDISALLPSAWTRAGNIFRKFLRDGDAAFAIARRGSDSVTHSPFISPLQSPISPKRFDVPRTFSSHRRSSSQSSEKDDYIQFPSHLPSSPTDPPSAAISSETKRTLHVRFSDAPRTIDYLTWSLLEFACLCQSPVTLQFRTFTHERTSVLHEALNSISNQPISPMGRPRLSVGTRPISSLFSKPRRGSTVGGSAGGTATSTAAPSPAGSPRLLAIDGAFTYHRQGRGSHLSVGPSSPTSNKFESHHTALRSGVHIVHLGPKAEAYSMGMLPPSDTSVSPTRLDSRRRKDDLKSQTTSLPELAKSSILLSPTLVAATYRRVRVVQARMGYTTLIPQTSFEKTETLDDPFVDINENNSELGRPSELDIAMRTLTPYAAILKCLEESRWLLDALEQGQVGELADDRAEVPPSPQQLYAPPGFVL